MQQRQQQNDQLQMKDAFNLFYLLANSHATTATVFLRTDFGRDGIGVHGMFGFFMILLWGGMTNSYPMFVFLCAYLLAVLSQRMKTFANSRKGIIPHSRYNGFPVVSKRLFPRMSERNAIGIDAFLSLAIGGGLTFVDKPLGLFIMAGFLSILLSEGITNELQRKRLQSMRDAEIEQRFLAETYKSGRF
jgi:hypothetical protein